MASKGHQVTAHLTSPERDEFEAYADLFHLDAAGLLALLFAREHRVGRIREVLQEHAAPDGAKDDKVTFRIGADAHGVLKGLAREAGCSVSSAGAALIRAELRERWLERAILTRFESTNGV